jgi:hypothetical protein
VTYREITLSACRTFALGKTLDAERVVRNTPKVLKFSPKVNKIINTKKQEKL